MAVSETLSSLPRPAAAPSHPPSHPKLRPGHLLLLALVYLRQSTPEQVRLNLESQRRQYALRDRAIGLGWAPDHVHVIDEDLGRSGADSRERTGFQRLISEVALGHVGIIFALEASRLARNNEDWQHLLRL
ncbi:Resolvase domain protein, partial [mine drainage metagenome]